MAFITLVEITLIAWLIWLIVSQCILPGLQGKPMFPILWTKQAKLDAEKARLLQQLAEQDTVQDIEHLRERLKHKERT